MTQQGSSIRLDKWLWYARFFKTRSLATKVVQSGKVRVDATPVSKASRTIQAGNVLTFPKEDDIRVIQVDALGDRRGPAPEAQALYTDLAPPQPKVRAAPAPRSDTKPSARDRKAQAAFKRDLH
ncbi:MAG: RNA-binding S4 domain-containing protein [Pseudomonadota bacterium]